MPDRMNAPSHEGILQECFALLEANEVDLDSSARAIVEFFFGADRHVALRDIEDFLRGRGMAVDLEKAQRTMHLLVDYGFASERRFPDGRERYEHLHIGEHHDHLYCLRCGAIIEFTSPELERLQDQLTREHGFHAFSHRLLIRGLCGTCFGGPETREVALAAVQAGGRFRVVRIQEDGGFGWGHGRCGKRLADLGLVAGTEGEVLSNHGLGLMVLQVAGARLALGQGQTRRVVVELLN
jgi:Fur family ferric uptake transcriptional regulator